MNTAFKKYICLLLCICLVFPLAGCGNVKASEEKTSIRIGVALYRGDDTFIGNLSSELEQCAKEYEQKTGTKIVMDVQAAKGSQATQNRQVERMLSLGCDVLCVNPVDRMSVSNIIDNAMEENIPIIFFNRQPAEEDMDRWDNLYYVGVDARETARLQGEIIINHYQDDPTAFDENGDGEISYVLLEGESSHQDSLIRTEVSIQTLMDAGIPIRRITGGIANWERPQASALMEQWLNEFPGQIELVISNNDDMALGALDALQRADVSGIEVVGIDATIPGKAAVEEGRMIGTVANDTHSYASAIFRMAIDKAYGKQIRDEIELSEGKYYWAPQEIINREDFH